MIFTDSGRTRRAFLGRSGCRPRPAGPGVAAQARPAPRRRPDRAVEPTAGPASSIRCTSPRRPSASSISTWPAARRIWKPSTTSRSSPRCTASRCRSRSPRASRSPSSRGRSSNASPRSTPFKKYGKSGQEISEIFPQHRHRRRRHLHRPLDEDRGDQSRPGPHVHEHRHDHLRPAGMGSWLWYGLGSESENLPGFVVLTSTGRCRPAAADLARGSGTAAFCRAGSRASSSAPRATRCCTSSSPQGVNDERQRDVVDAVQRAQPTQENASSTIRKSPRASPSTRWPSACRPACRD